MLGKLGTIAGSTTGALSGLLEVSGGEGITVDYVEDQPVLADASGLIAGAPGDHRWGPITATMKFDATYKAQYAALVTAAQNASASSTTETWTLTPPTGSTSVFTGYVEKVGQYPMQRGEHIVYEVIFRPTSAVVFTA